MCLKQPKRAPPEITNQLLYRLSYVGAKRRVLSIAMRRSQGLGWPLPAPARRTVAASRGNQNDGPTTTYQTVAGSSPDV